MRGDGVRRETGIAHCYLADVLRDKRQYKEAKTAYQAALEIAEELGDMRGMAVDKGKIGILACQQGELAEAAELLQEALTLWKSMNEPGMEAMAWHQLGIVYQQAKQWEAAEQAYRQSARLFENLGGGDGINAGASWNQLAVLCKATGRLPEAEQWYGKALVAFKEGKDLATAAHTLNNLADLLADDPARLDEARGLAEESLTIKEPLDNAILEIWTTYNILADIADKQGDSSQAAIYRAKGRQAYLAFPGWRQLYQHEPLIAAVVQATTDREVREKLEQDMKESAEGAWGKGIGAIRSLLNGERDEATLSEPLDYEEAAVIRAILEGIAEQA
ncbi:MAG: tetratricopeptide repeat protein [Candidatus Electrothrix sp. LOE2]|nr:tetratricopeptide repeat protein [Candidatus Electrothrix sp. LOE2]